jgi:hypothetical protein
MVAFQARSAALLLLLLLAAAALLAGDELTDKINELQTKFDRETNSVHKAKQLEKLGDAEFKLSRMAGSANDYKTVGLTMEKYRDNVRAALEALKKQHPDAVRHSNGYRQLEMHVQKGLREIDDTLIVAPPEFKPPLTLVRQDLIALDNELLRLLFPLHPEAKPKNPSPPATPHSLENSI